MPINSPESLAKGRLVPQPESISRSFSCSLPLITSVPSPLPISLAPDSLTPYPQTMGIVCPPDNPLRISGIPGLAGSASPPRGSLKSRLEAHEVRPHDPLNKFVNKRGTHATTLAAESKTYGGVDPPIF
jgi:hypothetical protein